MPRVHHAIAIAITIAIGLVSSCTIDSALDVSPPNPRLPIVKAAPLDILFVVDNSASMREEQETLLRSVWDPRCPLSDTSQVPLHLQDPSRETFEALTDVCGLSQLMAMMRGDFHIGVITTDVGMCDERLSAVQDPDNLHEPTPMRGCLQGPGVITRDSDVENDFRNAMLGVGTYGSSFERGLDAMEVFVTPGSRRGEGCENDLDGFLRPDGRLLVVFVVDEDDCSHRGGEGGFPDELVDEPQTCGDHPSLFINHSPTRCSEQADQLASIDSYRATLRGLIDGGRTTDVYVAVVGGLVEQGGRFEAAGCMASDGDVVGGCLETFGTSASCTEADFCCSADAASRYVQLARAVNADSLVGSICAPDFRAPLLPLFFQAELGGDDVFQ
jgi:hypothetical protein